MEKSKINNYILLEKLPLDVAYGVVYKAENVKDKKIYAIK